MFRHRSHHQHQHQHPPTHQHQHPKQKQKETAAPNAVPRSHNNNYNVQSSISLGGFGGGSMSSTSSTSSSRRLIKMKIIVQLILAMICIGGIVFVIVVIAFRLHFISVSFGDDNNISTNNAGIERVSAQDSNTISNSSSSSSSSSSSNISSSINRFVATIKLMLLSHVNLLKLLRTTTSCVTQETIKNNTKFTKLEQRRDQQTNATNVTTTSTAMTSSSSSSTTTTVPHYYIIFSTSCTDQQNWESWIFFYHCFRVKQPGNITRIASGCTPEETEQLIDFHEQYIIPSFGSNYNIHFTPDYSHHGPDGTKLHYPYKYFNKPHGVLDWLRNGPFQLKLYDNNDAYDKNDSNNNSTNKNNDPTTEASTFGKNIPQNILDSIVFLLDPDMILLRPIRHDYTNEDVIYAQDTKSSLPTMIVKHGYPMSQQDGYLNNQWMDLNFTYILSHIPEKDRAVPPPHREGPIYWNTGPPYIATVYDMYKISTVWSTIVGKVHNDHPELFAEMYGYIIATVQLKLRHTLIKSIVVSTTTSSDREGWAYIDSLPDTNELCIIANHAVVATPIPPPTSTSATPKLPIGLHYCKRYILGRNFISKYRIKKNILNCEKPLLYTIRTLNNIYPAQSEDDGSSTSKSNANNNNNNKNNNKYYAITPPRADLSDSKTWNETSSYSKPFGSRIAKREAFMLCALSAGINDAIRYLKVNTTYCINQQKPPNLNETYTVYDDPSNY